MTSAQVVETSVTAELMYLFRVWYVQCLAETNSEFDWIHPFESLTVIRFSCSEKFIEELDNNDLGRAFAKSNDFRFETV